MARAAGSVHLLITRKDVGQRPHIAGALDVVLAPQRVDPATFKTDIAQKHLQVGTIHDVINPAGMLGNPQGVDKHGRFDRSQATGHGFQHLHADAGDGRGSLRRILHDLGFQGLETRTAGVNVLLVVEVFLDEYVHQPIEVGDIGADLKGYMNIGEFGQPGAPGIADNEARAIEHRIFQKGRGHRMGLGHIRANHEKHLGFGKIRKGIGHRP